MISLVLGALIEILRLCMPLLIIFIVSIICKMIYRRIKYGYGCMDVIKKRNLNINVDTELMALTLKQLKGDYEVIETDKYNANFIIVSPRGVYFIEMCNTHRGTITGDLKNDKLEWYDDGKFHYIDNPFIRQRKDLQKFKRQFPNIVTKGFVVFGNDVLFDFTYRGNSNVTRTRNLAYKLQELLNEQNPNYSVRELKKIKLYLK